MSNFKQQCTSMAVPVHWERWIAFRSGRNFRHSLFGIFLIISDAAFSQQKISGTITGTGNSPLFGASIVIKSSQQGTTADENGLFMISAKPGDVLVISNIGYLPREIKLRNETSLQISLTPSLANLDEVIVTGYSAQKRKSLTGSVAIVSVKELKEVPAGSIEQMLQGRAAGVTVITSGQPGGANSVRMRGITSFGNTSPLVIVDGVPGSLHDLNANDIESLQVLKDGAASIYGVRGSNGVIVITTKRGGGKATISYDGYYGIQTPPTGNVFHLLNPTEMADLVWLAQKNSGIENPSHPQYGSGAEPVIPDYLLIGPLSGLTREPTADELAMYNIDYSKGDIYQIVRANKTGTDWFHEVFTPAPIQSHNISAQSGSEKSSYFFSLGYYNQQGALLNTYLKRYSVRVNTLFDVKNNIRIGENAYIFYKDNPRIMNQTGNAIGQTFTAQPIIPVYDINGGWAGTRAPGLGNSGNPVFQRTATKDDKANEWQITGDVFAEADFLKHFTARTSFGGTMDNFYYYNYGFRTYHDANNNISNFFSENAGYNRSWTWTNTLAYNAVLGNHDVKVLGGIEAIENYGRGVGGVALGYFTDNPNFRILNNGSNGFTNYSFVYQTSLYSLFGKVDYAYLDKYLLSATLRRDGSSKFGPDARYAVFPSVSAGWVVTRESFMKNIGWLNNLKVRGSYGELGNELNVDPANAFSIFGAGTGSSYYDINGTSSSTVQGFYATRYGNAHTGWETDKILNIGIDVTAIKNKLEFSFEWYKKTVEGLLFDAPVGALVGGGTVPKVNIGDIENKGIDFSATYHGSVGKDFKFHVSGIFSIYNSNITSIPPPGYFEDAKLRNDQAFVRNAEGHPIGSFFGYQVVGLFQSAHDVAKSPVQNAAAPGRFKYADIDGNDTINTSDRTYIGDPNPDFTYGINLSASYKGFDFSMFLYGSQGNDILNVTRYFLNTQDLLYNSWLPDRPDAKTPIAETESNFSTNDVPNSYYIENGSYLRCKSMIIGYTFPLSVLKRVGVEKFRVYLKAANLFTITKYTGLDPDLTGLPVNDAGLPSNSAFGIDAANYPNIRTYIVGVNLSL